MLFKEDSVSQLADGTMTLTFRTWNRPQAKAGGRYRTWGLLLEVESVLLIDPRDISDTDARRAGAPERRRPRHYVTIWRSKATTATFGESNSDAWAPTIASLAEAALWMTKHSQSSTQA